MEFLASYAERWSLDGDVTTPEQYLEHVRQAYLTSAFREWIRPNQVWGTLDEIIKRLNLSWEHVAFTNWSKCKSLTWDAPGASKNERKKAQDKQYIAHIGVGRPTNERLAIDELRPNAIFICCGLKSVVDVVKTADLDVPILRVFDQPRATNRFAPPSKFPNLAPFPKWLDDDAKLYQELVS